MIVVIIYHCSHNLPSAQVSGSTSMATREVRLPRRFFQLPPLEVRESTVANAGLGLFVLVDLPKGSMVTEFGGPIIDHKEARQLMERRQDTHIRSITPLVNCFDGRVTEDHPLTWYVENHLLASFANDPHGTRFTQNVKIVEVQVEGHKTPAGQYTSKRLFYMTTRHVAAGSEIFFNYGKDYHQRHFENI